MQKIIEYRQNTSSGRYDVRYLSDEDQVYIWENCPEERSRILLGMELDDMKEVFEAIKVILDSIETEEVL